MIILTRRAVPRIPVRIRRAVRALSLSHAQSFLKAFISFSYGLRAMVGSRRLAWPGYPDGDGIVGILRDLTMVLRMCSADGYLARRPCYDGSNETSH
jgi:hypothetical protein